MMSWSNYNFKKDANRIKVSYTGDFDKYLESLLENNCKASRVAFTKSEFSATMNFMKFCEGVAKVKQKECREAKINFLLS